ncbi:hypothetical protein PP178_12880 [Zeaxanthinibacter sp. PT1]|uniref:hypothetical protein n=1 Tax=Zeaxanthinibacter TaxID=561554 RepID=UPI00234B6683|nr:hypothetical protein [Zeaxanthinibacter sp. PT1]MDC6352447.1 hypothetical protein [Zeaxanthinibacter sp. PT1]
MKKVMLSAAALMIGGLAFGQVTNSAGTAPDATPVPNLSLDGDANTGLSIQNGDDNRVRVRQAGTSQSARTTQDNGAGTGGNLAWLMQTGEVQAASGVGNEAEVQQSGTANESFTKQEGDYNDAFTAQGQNNDASSGNKARIRQGTGQQAQDNFAAIEQDGDDNIAFTRQTYDNSEAWTRQVGNENKSMILQDAGPNQTDGHSAFNHQEGDRNESSIDQSGLGGRNTATAYQIGFDNQSKQLQVTSAPSGSSGNRGSVSQGTFFEIPSLSQFASDMLAYDPQANTVWFNPPTAGNKAKQTQYGENNGAEIAQWGGDVDASNYAEQLQDVGSSGNDAVIFQGHHYTGEPSNYAKQYQTGADNRAGLTQTGSANKALQDQRGDENEALSSQMGSEHLLNIHQRGNLNFGTSVQHGAGNAALLVQHDGQSYSIEQNAGLFALDRSAGGNQADILQMGPNGDFGAGAIPCEFDEPMNLDMTYDVPPVVIEDICDDC